MTTPSSDRPGTADAAVGAAGFAGAMVSFAFGRFAYGALLPDMRADLDLSFATAGLLQSANIGAYLCGTLTAGLAVARVPTTRLLVWALLGAAVTLAGVGASDSAVVAVVTMAALGFCGGLAWIGTATMVIERTAPARRGWLLGVACAGSGLGLPLVAALIEVLRWRGVGGEWRVVWWAMAVATLGIAVLVARLTRPDRAGTAADPSPERPRARATAGLWRDLTTAPVPRVLVVYGMFGLGSSVFQTFALATLSQGGGGGAAVVWAVFGVAGAAGALAVGRLTDRWGPVPVLTASLVACATATAVPAVSTALPAVLPAAVVFGVPLIGVGVVVTSLLSRALPTAARASRALAVATLWFSAGLTAGPVVAGVLIDRTRAFTLSFGLAAAALLLAAVLAVSTPTRAR